MELKCTCGFSIELLARHNYTSKIGKYRQKYFKECYFLNAEKHSGELWEFELELAVRCQDCGKLIKFKVGA